MISRPSRYGDRVHATLARALGLLLAHFSLIERRYHLAIARERSTRGLRLPTGVSVRASLPFDPPKLNWLFDFE